MALTKLNFNEIQNASETTTGINIDKSVSFKQQVILPTVTPPQDNNVDGSIWVDESTNNLKVRINLITYDLAPKIDYNNITLNSPYTFSLNGNVGIVNNLTVTGTGPSPTTEVVFRSSTVGPAQWSILEVKGDLTIASGCTLNLTRTPLIVRGNILGSGNIISPNGVNGGTGGVGGPGGAGGKNGYYMAFNVTPGTGTGQSGTNSDSTWSNQNGTSAISMPSEYGITSGAGGPGGRGTAGGGGGGYRMSAYASTATPGGSSGNGNPGGNGYNERPESSYYLIMISGGGGGAGGPGTPGSGSTPLSIPPGGPAATGIIGTSGGSAGVLSTPYIGIGTPSNGSSGSAGTSGGAGGSGNRYNFWYAPSSDDLPTDGSPGGTGGNGGAGGGTGGSHISIYCAGTISSSINIRPGKGGLTGGSTSLPRAQTGSLWLFTPTGSEPISGIDLTGGTGTPNGASGTLNRTTVSGVGSFFSDILFEASGPTSAKTKVSLTYP